MVADDVYAGLVIGAGDFQNLIGEIFVEIKLIERFIEEFALR